MQDLSYNDLGRVIANNRSGNAGDIRYAYDDLHGWLTGINSGAGFEQHLYREIEGKVKRWDGSISAMTWKAGANDVEHRYDYTFDGLNRMIDAAYSEKSSVASAAAYRYAFWEDDNIGILPDPQNRTQGNYGEHIVYDMNSNIIQMQRSGMLNDKSYGLIDNLGISYEGNQRVKITDAVRDNLDYANAFDFRDGVDSENEYAYNANGALIKDLNKDITKIEYDLLGNPLKVKMSDNRSIEYVYSADGRRLRTTHKKLMTKQYVGLARSIPYMRYESETFDYNGNLILKNNKPQMYRFSGGYYDFRDDGSLSDAHYYIADYQGNNRMVVNASTDAVEQVNHYYAYGGIIGNLSSNEGLQEFKFGDKKLDRTYGLDLYDFEARQYDAIAPWFTSIDPLAEKYYSISPYAYCAGDPVNLIDPDGKYLIFCGGFTGNQSELNDESYWATNRRLLTIMKNFDSYHEPLFYDGSCCSFYPGSLNVDKRFFSGVDQAHEDIKNGLFESLERDETGKIIEPIIAVAHSMGAAFAKGYLTILVEYAILHGLTVDFIEIDFAPHQPTKQKAVEGVYTIQISHYDDGVVGGLGGLTLFDSSNAPIEGVDYYFPSMLQSKD